jgi:hypothetical protein
MSFRHAEGRDGLVMARDGHDESGEPIFPKCKDEFSVRGAMLWEVVAPSSDVFQ